MLRCLRLESYWLCLRADNRAFIVWKPAVGPVFHLRSMGLWYYCVVGLGGLGSAAGAKVQLAVVVGPLFDSQWASFLGNGI
jgi:hypothetical protein